MTIQDEADKIIHRAIKDGAQPERRIGRRQLDREMYALLQRVAALFEGTDAMLGIDAASLLAKIDGATK